MQLPTHEPSPARTSFLAHVPRHSMGDRQDERPFGGRGGGDRHPEFPCAKNQIGHRTGRCDECTQFDPVGGSVGGRNPDGFFFGDAGPVRGVARAEDSGRGHRLDRIVDRAVTDNSSVNGRKRSMLDTALISLFRPNRWPEAIPNSLIMSDCWYQI